MEMETESAVLTEQRREIEEAKTLNSDLEFAFNLQMQEAMTASLSTLNHPPSTASTPSLSILNHPPSTALASSSSTPKNRRSRSRRFRLLLDTFPGEYREVGTRTQGP
ncbi:hypothetical protein OIU74_009589 [Salix koriyanagi]|uniref:Uncharacterized protein n=1 Tax=Salix koriyanagi TaxID=2511006 RepID=A0A9Q0Z105_9ROSI|nr:hypothetical protein OIU74_009589 [Salix koriyanagi]